MFSFPAPGRDSHLSFPIISSGSWGGEERQREPNYPPQCQAPSTWGSQVPPHLLPHRLRRCRSLPAPGQPSTDCATAATGKAPGAGMAEGKGMQLSARAKPKQKYRGGKKAAFIQAAKPQLASKISPSCSKTRVSPGVGMAAEAGGFTAAQEVSLLPPSLSSKQLRWVQTA